VKLLNLNIRTSFIKILIKEENFKWHLEAFASELFIYIYTYCVVKRVLWCFSQDIDGLNAKLSLMRSQSDSVLTEASTLYYQQKGKAERIVFLTFPTLWI